MKDQEQEDKRDIQDIQEKSESELIKEAEDNAFYDMVRKMFSILFPVIIYAVSYNILGFTIGFLGCSVVLPNMTIAGLCMLGTILAVVWVFPKGELSLKWSALLPLVAILAASSCVVLNYTISKSGLVESSPSYQQAAKNLYEIPFWMQIVLYGFISPIAEELLFRGVLFQRMKRIVPVWMAVVLSAIAFAIYHANLVQGIYALCMGLLMALVYEWSGSFLAPILFHTIANVLSCVVSHYPKMNETVFSTQSFIICIVVAVLSFAGMVFWVVCRRRSRKAKQD